jgi:hypothetical protein
MFTGGKVSTQICIIQRHTSIISLYSSLTSDNLIQDNIFLKYHKGYTVSYLLNYNKNLIYFDSSSEHVGFVL